MNLATPSKKRKLKINKNFQQLPENDGDEFYLNGIFEFNITKLLKFVKENSHIFQPEAVSVKAVRTCVSKNLSESTIQAADVTKPIVLAEIAPERFNVIDANHRLEKAHRDGIDIISAYKVRAEQHIAFLTSVSAYKEYVGYWNNKIKRY